MYSLYCQCYRAHGRPASLRAPDGGIIAFASPISSLPLFASSTLCSRLSFCSSLRVRHLLGMQALATLATTAFGCALLGCTNSMGHSLLCTNAVQLGKPKVEVVASRREIEHGWVELEAADSAVVHALPGFDEHGGLALPALDGAIAHAA